MKQRCENTIGKDTLLEFLATLERADDPAARRTPARRTWRSAVGTPVIGLYAATNPARSGPVSEPAMVRRQVRRSPPAGCYGKPASELPWTTKIERPGVMDLITPDEVIQKLHSVLLALARRR